jgi:hypothetical protein
LNEKLIFWILFVLSDFDFVSIHLVFGWFRSRQRAPGCSDFGSVGLGVGRLGVFFMAALCPQFFLLGFSVRSQVTPSDSRIG